MKNPVPVPPITVVSRLPRSSQVATYPLTTRTTEGFAATATFCCGVGSARPVVVSTSNATHTQNMTRPMVDGVVSVADFVITASSWNRQDGRRGAPSPRAAGGEEQRSAHGLHVEKRGRARFRHAAGKPAASAEIGRVVPANPLGGTHAATAAKSRRHAKARRRIATGFFAIWCVLTTTRRLHAKTHRSSTCQPLASADAAASDRRIQARVE